MTVDRSVDQVHCCVEGWEKEKRIRSVDTLGIIMILSSNDQSMMESNETNRAHLKGVCSSVRAPGCASVRSSPNRCTLGRRGFLSCTDCMCSTSCFAPFENGKQKISQHLNSLR